MNPEVREQSEFNDAINKLQRMNSFFHSCSIARYEKNADLWIQSLASLYSELITKMQPNEILKIKELKAVMNKIHKGFERSQGNAVGISNHHYWELLEFELFIREVYKSAGYEGKAKSDPGSALG